MSLSVHWLELSGECSVGVGLFNACKDIWGVRAGVEAVPFGVFKRRVVILAGVEFAWSDDRYRLTVRGGGLDVLGLSAIRRLFGYLATIQFVGRRLDVCYDDYDWCVKPRDLWDWYVCPDKRLYGGVRGGRRYEGEVEGRSGVSVYLGSVQSAGVTWCIYDKFVQSAGRINAARWEARYGQRVATEAIRSLAECAGDEFEFRRCMGGLVHGGLTFYSRRRTDGTALCNAAPPEFWVRLCGLWGKGVRFRGAELAASGLDAIKDSLLRQCSSRLYCVWRSYADVGDWGGWEYYLVTLMEQGRDRVRAAQLAAIGIFEGDPGPR